MLIAITGGIGCGKSIVSTVLRVMGYEVYDCDRAAKRLMIEDEDLRADLIALFGNETYHADGTLNKQHLSQAIFGNYAALEQMNALVHPAVARDLRRKQQAWQEQHPALPYFFESAILYESHFDQLSHPEEVWCVTAPEELRITRAMLRDHATRSQIEARLASQMSQEEKANRADHIIINDTTHSVIEQINQCLVR